MRTRRSRHASLLLLRIASLLLLGLLWLEQIPAPAASAAPALPAQPIARHGDPAPLPPDIQLARLGFDDRALRSATDDARLVFTMPASWQLTSGASFRMHYAIVMLDQPPAAEQNNRQVALRISMNGRSIGSIPVAQSTNQTISFPIDEYLRATASQPALNSISFSIADSLDCEGLPLAEVTIFADSTLYLPHQIRPVTPILANYPFPLVQNSIDPDAVTVVVPQKPTSTELEAAFAASASLRDALNNGGTLNLVRESDLSDAIRQSDHIVFVGRPTRFETLKAALPAPPAGDKFPTLKLKPDDGVVQIAVSPWNQERAILLTSGSSDEAVVKAAQGLQALRDGPRPVQSIAIISEVRDTQLPTLGTGRQTFAQLGMEAATIQGAGTNSVEYRFTLPDNRARENDVTFALSLAHSALISTQRSSVTVKLNSRVVGNIRLTDATAAGSVISLPLPQTLLRGGINRITVEAVLRPLNGCGRPSSDEIWLTVRNDSALDVAEGLAPAAGDIPFLLDNYPAPFTSRPDLSQVGIVVPADDPVAWNAAQHVLVSLADLAKGDLIAPQIVFADALPAPLRRDHDLLIVGRPSALPILQNVDATLPLVFKPGTDEPDDRRSRVVMRFAPPESQGYIQLAATPWDARRAMLLVLGRDDQELMWAADGLTNSALRRKLSSQLSLIQNDTVVNPPLIPLATTPVAASLPPAVAAQATAAPQATAGPPATADPQATAPGEEHTTVQSQRPGLGPLLPILIILGIAAATFILRAWWHSRGVG